MHTDPMLELAPNDPLVKNYLKDIQHLRDQRVTHELGLKAVVRKKLVRQFSAQCNVSAQCYIVTSWSFRLASRQCFVHGGTTAFRPI
jgi:hypothetical protein